MSGGAKIGIWGGPSAGKTTYLGALRTAALRMEQDWTISGDEASRPGSTAFLSGCTSDLDNGRLPGNSTVEATYAFKISRSGGLFSRRRDHFTLTVHDRPGGDYADIHDVADRLWSDLASCDGLVFLFDPDREEKAAATRERSARFAPSFSLDDSEPIFATPEPMRKNFHYVQHVADFVQQLCADNVKKDKKWLPKGLLPHRLAICISKFDQQSVFDRLRKEDLVRPDPSEKDGRYDLRDTPYVPDRDAKQAFELLADDLTIRTIERYFDPQRIDYYVISSTGFYADRNGRIDPDDASNVDPRDNSVRGEVRPVNVFEPLIALAEHAR